MATNLPTIPQFFQDASVFITGGSGFMGKVLIEKLLRSCPDVAKIYVLVRSKKGKDSTERLDGITQQALFDRLRKENPSSFSKLLAISGDVTEPGLGMRSEDKEILQQEVSVVFHAAASVRFDDAIKDAVLINVRGTLEVVNLALGMKKLKVLLHVSTAYSNCDQTQVFEKLYPPHGNWRTMIRLAEDETNDHILRMLTPKIIGNLPNTYTYAKSLTEHLIKDFEDRLPVVIFRPSVVMPSVEEPTPGWIDNFNGPGSLMVGGGKGLLRSLYGDPNLKVDYVPVDISIKAMIVAAWKRAVDSKSLGLPVYNCCSMVTPITMRDFFSTGKKVTKEYPLENALWEPKPAVTSILAVHFFKVIFLHMLPALLIDGLLKARGEKAMLTKLQRRIHIANMTLSWFLLKHVSFDNRRFLQLHTYIKSEDMDNFGYKVVEDNYRYLVIMTLGFKVHLLNEKLENIPRALEHYRRLYWLNMATKTIVSLLLLWFVGPYIMARVTAGPLTKMLQL